MNQTITQSRVLRGEFGKRRDKERARRRRNRLHALLIALGVILAAFLLWVDTHETQIILGTLLAFGFVVVLRMWVNLPRARQ